MTIPEEAPIVSMKSLPGSQENPIDEGIDPTPEYDPEIQTLRFVPIVDNRDGTFYKKTAVEVVDLPPRDLEAERLAEEELAIATKIRELKYKVALGTATTTEKNDLKMLIS